MITLRDTEEQALSSVGGKAAALGEALRQGLPVPPGVVIAPDEDPPLTAIRATLGPGPYAVRSSSPSEDGAGRSWAGQFASRIPVVADDLGDAIVAVRGSGSSDRALAYGSDGEAIPVLVQPVIDAEAAGIAFSVDPVDGDERYGVVEAVPGLATALADGTITPSRWRVRLSTRLPDHRATDPLSATALQEVVDLVISAAEWLGRPCDVEWAWDGIRVWLVQARPVTAATWAPAPGQWTAANIRENVPGIVSPLAGCVNYLDVMPAHIEETMSGIGIIDEGERVADVGRFYGHVYWRVDLIKERLLRLPGFVESSFDETVGIQPSYEGDGRRSKLTPRTLLTAARAGLTIVRGYYQEGPLAQRYAERLAVEEASWLVGWEGLEGRQLADRLAAARDLHHQTTHHSFIVAFIAEQAQDALRGLVQMAAKRCAGDIDQRLLLAGLGQVATAAAGDALAALAARHADRSDAILATDRIDELPPDVAAGLREVIADFGWMAPADDELAHPRWDEDPRLPFALFKGAVRAAASGTVGRRASLDGERLAQQARVLEAAGLLRPVLRLVLSQARRYQRFREELRVALGRVNRIVRRAFLEQGRQWAATGVIEQPEDVFWLTTADCDRLLGGDLDGTDARALVAARRAHAHRFRNWEPPLTLGVRTDVRVADAIGAGGELCGVGCSSGVATGPVAVLHRLEDIASVEAGSILVIKHGNPGWTPAFLVAAGLVVEEGGLLSHSSVVAREHGVPTVINVPGVTSWLRDGERVEVDGRRGRVVLLDREEP